MNQKIYSPEDVISRPSQKNKITINGERGTLEGLYSVGQPKNISAPIILLLHPQPNSNGTMYNKIIQETFNFLVKMGFVVLTINFGGVGNSTGKIENGFGEFLDSASAFKWLCDAHPYTKSRWVFGFSFGAYVAAQLTMRRPEIDHFIFLSTPIDIYDFSFFSPCPVHGMTIHSTHDKIVQESKIINFLARNDKCQHVSHYQVKDAASHFFTNIDYEAILGTAIYKYIKHHTNGENILTLPAHEALLDSVSYLEHADCLELMEDCPRSKEMIKGHSGHEMEEELMEEA